MIKSWAEIKSWTPNQATQASLWGIVLVVGQKLVKKLILKAEKIAAHVYQRWSIGKIIAYNTWKAYHVLGFNNISMELWLLSFPYSSLSPKGSYHALDCVLDICCWIWQIICLFSSQVPALHGATFIEGGEDGLSYRNLELLSWSSNQIAFSIFTLVDFLPWLH